MSKRLDSTLISALMRLEKEGKLDKHQVLEAARDPRNPLHKYFEWDNSKAAEAYRLEQAAELIRSASFKVKDSSERFVVAPVYVRDPGKGPSEPGHVNVTKVADDPELAAGVLADAALAVEELMVRHKLLLQLLGIESEVMEHVRAIQESIQKRNAKRPARGRGKNKGDDDRPRA